MRCLNEIEKSINISYQNYNLTVSNYKQLKVYYENRVMDESGKKISTLDNKGLNFLYNFSNVKKECKIEKPYVAGGIYSNQMLAHGYHNGMNRIYESTLSLKTNTSLLLKLNFIYKSFDNLINDHNMMRKIMVINDINYLNSVLKLVGERYE